jgi:hypothetical protein
MVNFNFIIHFLTTNQIRFEDQLSELWTVESL